MKRLFLISLFLLFTCSSAFALIVTDNVDSDNFLYQQNYVFATDDLAASVTNGKISISDIPFNNNFYYVLPRDGKLAGIAVSGSAVCTAGGATFDVTINDTVTGLQAWIQPQTISASGNTGSAGSQYSYMRQYRNETAVAQGFRQSGWRGNIHNVDNPYGKATPLVAGDRIGVRVTTSSGLDPLSVDYVVTIYVLD